MTNYFDKFDEQAGGEAVPAPTQLDVSPLTPGQPVPVGAPDQPTVGPPAGIPRETGAVHAAPSGAPPAVDYGLDVGSSMMSGVWTGLANLAGMPVDAVAWTMRKVAPEFGPSNPTLGSKQLLALGRELGLIKSKDGEDTIQRVVRRIGEEIGASVLPAAGMLAAGGRAVARAGAQAAHPLLRQAGARPGQFAATEAGLATSAGAGAGVAQEMAPGNKTAEFVGQIAGAFSPVALNAMARGAVRQVQGRNMQDVIDEFAEVGLTPSAAQAATDSAAPILLAAASRGPGGVNVYRRFLTRQQERLRTHLEGIAEGVSAGADPTRAGVTIKRGIDEFVGRFRDRSRRMYGRLNQHISPDERVVVDETARMLDDVTGPIPGAGATSEALGNARLNRLAEAFFEDSADGTLPFEAVQRLRTRIGEMLTNPQLVEDIPRGALKRVYGALTDDMRVAAQVAGGDALRAFDTANGYYRRNIQTIDDFLQPLMDKNLPEQVYNMATRGKEGATQIGAIRNSLTSQQWRVVSSAVMRRMGRANPSAQDAAGNVFNSETFLTQWNRIDPSAKNAMFRGVTPTLRTDLDKIARVASRMRDERNILYNPSGTANVAAVILGLTGFVSGNMAAMATAAGTTAVSGLGTAFLTNPSAVRWLAQATEIPLERLPGHMARLVTQAKKDPHLAETVEQLLSIINDAAGMSEIGRQAEQGEITP